MKEPLVLDNIKTLPKYFEQLENTKKLNTQEVYKLYNELRASTDEVKTNSIKEKIDKLTEENIFLEKITSIFDGNYLSTYFKLHNLITDYDITLRTSLEELGHFVAYINPKTVEIKELMALGERLNTIQGEYYLKGKFLKQLLTPKSRSETDEYYEKRFSRIRSQISTMATELYYTD